MSSTDTEWKAPTPFPWVLDGHNMSQVLHCTAERGSPEAKHICGDYEIIATFHGDNWKANAEFLVDATRLLTDPNAVHINMLRGTIAKPSIRQIIHIYGVEALRAELATSPPPIQGDEQ